MDALSLAASVSIFGTVALLVMGLLGKREVNLVDQLRHGTGVPRHTAPVEAPHTEALREKRYSRIPSLNRLLSRSGIVARWAITLEQADLPLRVEEYLAIRIIAALLLAFIGLLVINPFAALVGGLLGYIVPGLYAGMALGRRLRQIDGQLAELLTVISNGLKSGYGLLQAFDFAAQQLAPPINKELRRTLREANLGAGIDGALETLQQRIPSADLELIVTAISIQRTVGGNLAEVLDNVAHTMRERARIRGEVHTLTAQQRLAGFVIGALPIFLAFVLWLINPEYMSAFFNNGIGRAMLLGAGVLEVLGVLTIRRILAIEV